MINEYISKTRVERDGVLVAYEGEVMSDDEARKRGLLDKPIPEKKAKASKKAAGKEKAADPERDTEPAPDAEPDPDQK